MYIYIHIYRPKRFWYHPPYHSSGKKILCTPKRIFDSYNACLSRGRHPLFSSGWVRHPMDSESKDLFVRYTYIYMFVCIHLCLRIVFLFVCSCMCSVWAVLHRWISRSTCSSQEDLEIHVISAVPTVINHLSTT